VALKKGAQSTFLSGVNHLIIAGKRYQSMKIVARNRLKKQYSIFMDEQDLDELIPGSASCQSGLRSWIQDTDCQSTCFTGAHRKHPYGYPPNSPYFGASLTHIFLLVKAKRNYK
jgi:hypothetical protein